VKRLRAWLTVELNKHGVRVFPSAANFLLADFGERGPAFFKQLVKQNILVRDRRHDIGPGYARITIGTQSELQQLLRILRNGRY
jgi:histidinol-phosphate/aromatic aminotransferase/cobyric acid decarboxylase-like protein